jgi:hypothetical protein
VLPSYYDIGGSSNETSLFIDLGDATSFIHIEDNSLTFQPPLNFNPGIYTI